MKGILSTGVIAGLLICTTTFASDASLQAAKQYCESVSGTPERFHFAYIDHDGKTHLTGVEQYWCNLHLPVDSNDTTDVHSYVEVETLARGDLNLVAYALAHPQTLEQPQPGNPAYYYCRQVNGTLPGLMSAYQQVGWIKDINHPDMYGGCMFADGSTISQWALAYAQHYPDFAKRMLAKFK